MLHLRSAIRAKRAFIRADVRFFVFAEHAGALLAAVFICNAIVSR